MTSLGSVVLVAVALAALPAVRAAPALQQAPAQPAAAPQAQAAPAAGTLQDPTQADAQLLRALGAAGSRAKSSGILVALRGLVVRADGGGIAVLETGERLVRVTLGQELTLDTAAQHRVRVVSLDASGVVLQDVVTGQQERFD